MISEGKKNEEEKENTGKAMKWRKEKEGEKIKKNK
jgi:hypothetical protein